MTLKTLILPGLLVAATASAQEALPDYLDPAVEQINRLPMTLFLQHFRC